MREYAGSWVHKSAREATLEIGNFTALLDVNVPIVLSLMETHHNSVAMSCILSID
jgi:hypothetical protein